MGHVGPIFTRGRFVVGQLAADFVGQVLDERATEGDIDDLQATADAQERFATRGSFASQVELGVVTQNINVVGFGVLVGAVQMRLDVAAARDQDPIDVIEVSVEDIAVTGIDRRQEHRDAPSGDDCIDVRPAHADQKR